MSSLKASSKKPPRSVKSVEAALQKLNHATAQEIADWINSQPKNLKRIGLTSVYRGLNYLVEQADVKPLNFNDGMVRYELNHEGAHHHHFICTECNAIQALDICPFESALESHLPGASIHYHNFELFGLCAVCNGKTLAKD